MRLLLFIFLLCIFHSAGIAKTRMDTSHEGSLSSHESELTSEFDINDHSALLDFSLVEYIPTELKVKFDIRNYRSTPHLYIVDTLGKNANFNPKTIFF